MDDWYLLLRAAIAGDRDGCIKYSLNLKYLTGEENDVRDSQPFHLSPQKSD